MRNHKQPTDRHPNLFGIDDFLLGVVGGGIIDAFSSHNANQASIAQANANRDFSRNAHQIEVADLRAAGLNPMLTFKGSGAQISGGAMPSIKPLTEDTGSRINSAMMLRKEMQMKDSQINLANTSAAKAAAETANVAEDTKLKQTQGRLARAHIVGTLSGARQADSAVDRNIQEIEESKNRIAKMGSEITQIAANIKVLGEEHSLKVALTEGHKIDNQIKDANYNAILSMAKSDALIKEYEAIEKELGAKAAQAAWRVWLAEQGLTLTQIEKVISSLPNIAFIYPLKQISNTTINSGKK